MRRGTLDEATIALACANADITYCMLAKREVSKLYEDIQQPPYTVLFNGSVTALRLWRAVQVLRVVDSELKTYQDAWDGKDRLIAIHGNRFVLHSVFKAVGTDILEHASLKIEDSTGDIKVKTGAILNKTVASVAAHFPTAYPSNLFKNVKKCKELAGRI